MKFSTQGIARHTVCNILVTMYMYIECLQVKKAPQGVYLLLVYRDHIALWQSRSFCVVLHVDMHLFNML